MTSYEIPLIAAPQTFTCSIAGILYGFDIRWNVPLSAWVLSLADSQGNPLVSSIAMVTGSRLLAQYPNLGLGFDLFVSTDQDPEVNPTFTNLGADSHLYMVIL
jgi:hypothetical protein